MILKITFFCGIIRKIQRKGKIYMSDLITGAKLGKFKSLYALGEQNLKKSLTLCEFLLPDNSTKGEKCLENVYNQAFSRLSSGEIGEDEKEFTSAVLMATARACYSEILKEDATAFDTAPYKNSEELNIQFSSVECEKDIDNSADYLESALEKLTHIERFVFVLHLCAGLNIRQVSKAIKIKETFVSRVLRSAYKKIEKSINEKSVSTLSDIPAFEELTDLFNKCSEKKEYTKEQTEMLKRCSLSAKKPFKFPTVPVITATVCIALILAVVLIVVNVLNKPKDENSSEVSSSQSSNSDTITDENGVERPEGFTDKYTATAYADIDIIEYGKITVALDATKAPKTVENFINLAKSGFYDGLTFHRIMEGFMMQGGDPNHDGTGGNTNENGNEINVVGEFYNNGFAQNNLTHKRGAISMARSSAYDSASSQFFIVHKDSYELDKNYAVFGYVTEGIDVVDAVCSTAQPTDDNGTITFEDQPVISSITIREAE